MCKCGCVAGVRVGVWEQHDSTTDLRVCRNDFNNPVDDVENRVSHPQEKRMHRVLCVVMKNGKFTQSSFSTDPSAAASVTPASVVNINAFDSNTPGVNMQSASTLVESRVPPSSDDYQSSGELIAFVEVNLLFATLHLQSFHEF